jgi:hypothetical protein
VNEPNNELNFVESDVFRLMQNHYKRSEDTAKGLDDKAQQIITIASIIVGLISAFNIGQGTISINRQYILLAMFVSYVVSCAAVLDAMFPRKWKGEPLEADWAKYKQVVKMTTFDYYEWVIEAYIEAIDINANVLARKSWDVKVAIFFLVVEVGVIFLLIAFQP